MKYKVYYEIVNMPDPIEEFSTLVEARNFFGELIDKAMRHEILIRWGFLTKDNHIVMQMSGEQYLWEYESDFIERTRILLRKKANDFNLFYSKR